MVEGIAYQSKKDLISLIELCLIFLRIFSTLSYVVLEMLYMLFEGSARMMMGM